MPLDEFNKFPEDKLLCLNSINYPVLILGDDDFLFEEEVESIFNFLDHRISEKETFKGDALRFDLSVALHETTVIGSVCNCCGEEALRVALPLPNFKNFNLFANPSKIFFCENCEPSFMNCEIFHLKNVKKIKNSENYNYLRTVSAYGSSIEAHYLSQFDRELADYSKTSISADAVYSVLLDDLQGIKKNDPQFTEFGINIVEDAKKVKTYTNWRLTSVVENMRLAPFRFKDPLGETKEDVDLLIDRLMEMRERMNTARLANYEKMHKYFILSFAARHINWFEALEKAVIDDDQSSLWCLIVAVFLLRFPEGIFDKIF